MAERAGSTLAALMRETRAVLAGADLAEASLEARLLVEHFTATTRTDALTDPGRAISSEVAAAIRAAVARRLAGEPLHRILGVRSFYGLDLRISPATLEPRPDTETLVDAMLAFVRDTVARTGSCRILDLGTGTGAIALALLAEVPEARATGVDIVQEALDTARHNARALGLDARFSTLHSDWLASVDGQWDAIVSNPPYIKTSTIADLEANVRDHDPMLGLDGGADGLDAYLVLAANTAAYLAPGGQVGLEIGFDQKLDVTSMMVASGFALVSATKDLGGNDRVLVFERAIEAHFHGV